MVDVEFRGGYSDISVVAFVFLVFMFRFDCDLLVAGCSHSFELVYVCAAHSLWSFVFEHSFGVVIFGDSVGVVTVVVIVVSHSFSSSVVAIGAVIMVYSFGVTSNRLIGNRVIVIIFGFIIIIVIMGFIVVIVRVIFGGDILFILVVITCVIFGVNFTVTITDHKTVRVAPGKTVDTVNNVLWHW